MDANHNLLEADYYNDLTDYEKAVLGKFDELLKRTYCSNSVYYSEHSHDVGGYCIVKKDGVWKSYIYERGQAIGIREYTDVYELVVDLFDGLDYNSTIYCIDNFPKKEEFTDRTK
jgi:hypothetical protein